MRFFLLREVPFGADGSYSHDAIVGRMNADLANNLGNLAQRSLSMVAKNCEGKVPPPGTLAAGGPRTAGPRRAPAGESPRGLRGAGLPRSLEAIWTVLGDTNAYFAEQAPWVLRKTDVERMNTVLYVTLEVLRIVSILVQPVMPTSAASAAGCAGTARGRRPRLRRHRHGLGAGHRAAGPAPIFPKYEEPAAG